MVVTIWLSVPLFKRAAIIVLQVEKDEYRYMVLKASVISNFPFIIQGSPEVTALDGTKTTPQTITREIQASLTFLNAD